MTACAIHISDLHRGTREAPELDEALVTLCQRAPARARDRERRPLEPLPARGARGGQGSARPAAGTDARRSREPRHPVHPSRTRDEPVEALRGRLRHHRSGSPHPERRRLRAQLGPPVASSGRPARARSGWRRSGRSWPMPRPARCGSSSATTTSQALPGGPRGSSRSSTATRCSRSLAAAGTELVLGGHIHQGTAVERHAFQALDDDDRGARWCSRPRPASAGRVPAGSARRTASMSCAGRPTRSRSRRGSGAAAASSPYARNALPRH